MAKAGKLGLILGMATGAITGLLFAPQKGKELRKKISQEREGGGVGHKAIAKNMGKMADDISDLVKDVAASEEAMAFWAKTNEHISEITGGAVELDEWVKNAHEKADELKSTVSKYATEKKKYMKTAESSAKRGVRKAKSSAKKGIRKAKSSAKKGVRKAKSTVKRVKSTARKAAPKRKAAPRKKSTTKKK